MRTTANYDAVVFDNDGVLVEPTDATVLRDAVRAAFAAVGVPDPDDQCVELAADHEDIERLAAIEVRTDVSLDEFWRTRERYAVEHQRAHAIDGGKPPYPDVELLSALDTPLGVVSNNQQATVEHLLSQHGLANLFDWVSGREPTLEGLARRKPNPYYIEAALDGLDAETTLYVGDSPKDVVAAARAGVDSAFVRRPHRRDVSLDREPTIEVGNLQELVRTVRATSESDTPQSQTRTN
jgi:phosphoglycolate phosphatase